MRHRPIGRKRVIRPDTVRDYRGDYEVHEERVKMMERAREVTRNGKYTYVEYARFADDLVVLIDAYKRHDWLIGAVTKRLREEFAKLQVEGSHCAALVASASAVFVHCRASASQ